MVFFLPSLLKKGTRKHMKFRKQPPLRTETKHYIPNLIIKLIYKQQPTSYWNTTLPKLDLPIN